MARSYKNNPVTFDTLSYAKKLKSAGFTQEQAEIQAETFLAIVQEQLVSKRDLKELEKEMKLEIENVRLDIEKVRKDTKMGIELLRRDLKIWFGGMLVAAVSVLSAMMTLIVHLAR